MSLIHSMGIGQLLRWQWEGYPKYHQSHANLLIHIVAVPLFLLGTIVLVAAIVQLSLVLLAVAIGCVKPCSLYRVATSEGQTKGELPKGELP